MAPSDIDVADLTQCLIDKDAPIGKRMRCIFLLKAFAGEKALAALATALQCESVLVAHEVAYAIGQLKDERAIPVLSETLANTEQHPVVRHEAAEALGAIGSQKAIPVLERFVKDSRVEVSESCEIALELLRYRAANKGNECPYSGFDSVDPAPPSASTSVPELIACLCNEEAPLFERYRAMFALRNLQTEEATLGLCRGFQDKTSALFRHEIAYVLGQLQHPASATALSNALGDSNEHPMVRHEAAEALGAIPTDEVLQVLNRFSKDPVIIVKESCEAALDIHDHWAERD